MMFQSKNLVKKSTKQALNVFTVLMFQLNDFQDLRLMISRLSQRMVPKSLNCDKSEESLKSLMHKM